MTSVEELIEAVRRESVLYDTGHPDYVKGNLKDEIWAQIANTLQYKDGSTAKEAWLKIRNCHRDALRRQKKLKGRTGSRAVAIKPWKYQQQMEFLIPYMAISANATSADNDALGIIESDTRSEDDPSLVPCEYLFPSIVHDGAVDGHDDDGSTSSVDISSPSRETKKKKVVDTRNERTDISLLFKQSIENREQRSRQRPLEATEGKLEERDPLYYFFMGMYATTAKMPPASQLMIKREVFRIVSDAEETLLAMPLYTHDHSSPP
ncbi:uncharacterized protein LOC122250749 [Penaeus japonicus]|uniref:uncharacterized protein LOC122250749 n=1 Tax=Penaeus japonicus TaxID=27405 RepID=UPI001C714C78|nr:uncharacterized protein LOC122250749 [Penaeus japonicus]